MSDPEKVLPDSPADFDSSVAYALHAEMRRLIILVVVGSLLLSVGMAMFTDPGTVSRFGPEIFRRVVWLGVGLVGATLFFGGLVGALFKIVTDATIVATEYSRER